MKTLKEWAEYLNAKRCEYRSEFCDLDLAEMKADGVVACFGDSNDNAEFDGAWRDEMGCCDGGLIWLNEDRTGLYKVACDDDECPHERAMRETLPTIEAVWWEDGPAWTYKTEIPHETFDVWEDGAVWCRGILFQVSEK